MKTQIQVVEYPPRDWPQIKESWTSLVSHSPYASFFMQTGWVESWLRHFGPYLCARILLFYDAERIVGGLVVVRRKMRHGPIPVDVLFVNTGGEDPLDQTYAKYNTILCLPGYELLVVEALHAYLNQSKQDEVRASSFAEGVPLEALLTCMKRWLRSPYTEKVEPSYYVDLQGLRESSTGYLEVLSSNTRRNVRRANKKFGDVSVGRSHTISEAIEMFNEMVNLHQNSWNARGQPGSYASVRKTNFIKDLITTSAPIGSVFLLRVRNEAETIGIVLCFDFAGRVQAYSGGYSYRGDPKVSPGITTLFACVEYCLNHGYKEFDFLAGETDYKRAFSTHSRNLHWISFHLPTIKNAAILSLRTIKRQVKKLASLTGGLYK